MNNSRKIVDTFQIIGFITSVLVSIILIFVNVDPVISTILGFILAILVQLFDLQFRLKESEEKILAANSLNNQLYSDNWLMSQIEQLVNDYFRISNNLYEPYLLSAKDSLENCNSVFHELAEGVFIHYTSISQSPYSFGNDAIKRANKSLDNVAISDGTYWRTNSGERFFQEHLNAISRGVAVRRIFVNTPTNLEAIKDVMQQHHEAGIKVFVAHIEDIPKELHGEYVIMDNKLINQAEFTGKGRIKHWRMSIESFEVNQLKRKFELLFHRAIPYSEFNKTDAS